MTKLAFDMSSYMKTALLTGKDAKDGRLVVFEDKEVLVNSAEYGYEIFTNMMVKTLADTKCKPIDCLLVFEGMNSKSRRLLTDSNYKGKRDKRPPEFYEEFARLREYVEQVWKDLGAIAMCQHYVEGDDVLAYLAQETEEDLIICSRDGDMGVLNTETANQYGAKVQTYNDGLLGMAKIDGELWVHPFKYITLYKALVGDSSDNIAGVKGFGPAKFQALAEKYGYDGLDELMGLLEGGKLVPLHEVAMETKGGTSKDKDKPVHPLIKMIVDAENDAVRSWKLARLYPEWVTFHRPTVRSHLEFRPGKVAPCPTDADERISQWYGQQYLVTVDTYDDAVKFLSEQMAVTPIDVDFDIETSSPPESDDWLAALGDPFGVDQLGQTLTGFSLTFGDNKQHTYYVSVDHRDTANVSLSQARRLLEVVFDAKKEVVVQNNFFELTVLYQTCDEDGTPWREHWEKYGYRGFVPNTLDTKLEASYVNENISRGLKFRSKHHLGYEQQTFEATAQKVGHPDELPKGGRVREVLEKDDAGQPIQVRKQYKMNELTADEVVAYGCDDTICTGALHRFYKFVMQLEHHYHVYLDVEIDASYQHAKNFIDGIPFSLETMREQEKHDDETYNKAWATVRAYLLQKGWDGTVPPTYDAAITAAQIKEAYKIVMLGAGKGEIEIEDLGGSDDEEDEAGKSAQSEDEEVEEPKDAFLASRVRTPAKLVALLRSLGHETFAGMVEQCLNGEHEKFTAWVREHFSGEPIFAISNKQMTKLLYGTMGLPIRVRNKPTEKMRKEGKDGNPKGDVLAIAYALRDADDEQKAVLEGLRLMQMVKTRRSLYYSKYPYFLHWKTGRVHPTHNQCETNTRRASEAKPNKQQLPKHPKIEGQASKFRETIVPHRPGAVILSMDFVAQELRVIADFSHDENMVACFVGENKKDMHALTGSSVLQWRERQLDWSYKVFKEVLDNSDHPEYKKVKEHRNLGKKINFTTEFGAMAPKLAMTMLVSEAEAQVFIDAKEKNFPGVRKWKNAVIDESKKNGIVRTKSGAVRHLASAYMSDDHWLKSKAERRSVNFKVQSSSAEMTKKAEGRMWQEGLFFDFDAVCLGPVHDEIVASVMVDARFTEFLQKMHACMVGAYADMWIPIESSISFGKDFYNQVEVGEQPEPAAIAAGLEKVFGKTTA